MPFPNHCFPRARPHPLSHPHPRTVCHVQASSSALSSTCCAEQRLTWPPRSRPTPCTQTLHWSSLATNTFTSSMAVRTTSPLGFRPTFPSTKKGGGWLCRHSHSRTPCGIVEPVSVVTWKTGRCEGLVGGELEGEMERKAHPCLTLPHFVLIFSVIPHLSCKQMRKWLLLSWSDH